MRILNDVFYPEEILTVVNSDGKTFCEIMEGDAKHLIEKGAVSVKNEELGILNVEDESKRHIVWELRLIQDELSENSLWHSVSAIREGLAYDPLAELEDGTVLVIFSNDDLFSTVTLSGGKLPKNACAKYFKIVASKDEHSLLNGNY